MKVTRPNEKRRGMCHAGVTCDGTVSACDGYSDMKRNRIQTDERRGHVAMSLRYGIPTRMGEGSYALLVLMGWKGASGCGFGIQASQRHRRHGACDLYGGSERREMAAHAHGATKSGSARKTGGGGWTGHGQQPRRRP